MAHHTIDEAFKAVKPKRRKGIPNAPTIGIGVTSNNTDLSTSLSQAGQQISLLQSTYQRQASLIMANTEAIQGNTSAQGGRSALGTASSVASGLLGGFGGFGGLLSPLISGIASLFGGGSTPAPLPIYTPPPAVAISGNLNSAAPNAGSAGAGSGSGAQSGNGGLPSAATQVTVHVSAMDSKSFMDHSSDIANAVREAMLNMHPINGVVASL